MDILITGACGMVGSHMVDYFYENGRKILGTYYKPTIDIVEIEHKAKLIECDIRYYQGVLNIIAKYKPKKIFHLAAQSFPTISWERPIETMDINVNGTINLFEAIKNVKLTDDDYDPIVVVACSSAEYGASLTQNNVPVREDVPLLPLHPYGVSKVAQDLLSYQYFVNDNIKTIRARIFNTTGPRKINDVTSDFTKRAVELEKNNLKTIKVGNIETYRSITDVRDLVQALIRLSEKGRYGEVYNISGEKAYKIGDILKEIKDYIGIDFNIELDPALLRTSDELIIYGDSTKIKNDTGWKQEYPLKRTIVDMINYWRTKL